MGKTVQRHVAVYNEKTGESEILKPGMKVPDYAKDQVTNPKVFEKPAGSDNEAPVNNEVLAGVYSEQQPGVDGSQVEEAPDADEDDDLEVNETPNANPAQRQTADKPGGNQAPDDKTVAPADDPANPASSVGGAAVPDPEADTEALADKAETAKKTADANRAGQGRAGEPAKKAASSRRSTTKKTAAKKSTNS